MPKLNIPAADYSHEFVAGNQKTAIKDAGATTGQIIFVDATKLRELDGFNVRIDTPDYLEHVTNIESSIESNGFYPNKPLGGVVAKEGDEQVFEVTDGYTRLRAIKNLLARGVEVGLIPFMPKPAGTTIEDLTIALVQDNEGRPLSVFERAIVAKRLASYNVSAEEIAKRLGKTERYVSDLLVLAGAPSTVRNQVIQGKISATEAVKQLRKHGNKASEKITEAVKTAEAAGKKRATGKDTAKASGETNKAAPPAQAPKPTVRVETLTFDFKQGSILPVGDIKPVAQLLGATWWNFVDEKTDKEHVIIEESVRFDVSATRPVAADSSDDTFDVPTEGQGASETTSEDEGTTDEAAAAAAHLDAVTTPAGGDDEL